jgi:hypothetical protein
MISDENIATAQIAQIFGSELLKAQQSARTDAGSVPDFVKINPQQFLVNQAAVSQRKKLDEQRLIQMLQREAEAACPLPESSQPTLHTSSPALPTHTTNIPQHQSPSLVVGKVTPQQQALTQSLVGSSDVLERIANSLERIANAFDKVEVLVKKRKTKRAKNLNESVSQ